METNLVAFSFRVRTHRFTERLRDERVFTRRFHSLNRGSNRLKNLKLATELQKIQIHGGQRLSPSCLLQGNLCNVEGICYDV